MLRASDSQSSILRATGLPVNLRTHTQVISQMDEKPSKQKPERKADNQDNSEDPEELTGRKGISRVSMKLLYGGGFAFFAAWAGLYANLGHTFWIVAASVMVIASVCAALGLRLELRNHHWLKWQYNGIAYSIVIIASFLLIPITLVTWPPIERADVPPLKPDYIEGTKKSRKDLEDTFSFGYVVFRLKDKIWTYQPYFEEHTRFQIEWSEVKIEPNFVNRTVSWNFPEVNFTNSPHGNWGRRNRWSATIPMRENVFRSFRTLIPGFADRNDPSIFIGTLSENQLHPVFVIGFRIISEQEDHPLSPPVNR